jgi:succinoglycan biosynthesis transport protein ExoP
MTELIPSEESTFDVRRYLITFWTWLWLIAFLAILAGAAAYSFSQRQTPVYRASTSLLINAAPLTQTATYDTILTNQGLSKTYAELMKKGPVLNSVVQKLGLKISAAELASVITVTPVANTQLIQVDVVGTDPARTAQIANTLVEVFSQQIQDMQTQRYAASKQSLQSQMNDLESQIQDYKDQLAKGPSLADRARLEDKISQLEQSNNQLAVSYENIRLTEAQTISSAVPAEQATVPTVPISPNTRQNTFLAALMGALLATCGVFVFESLNDKIRDPGDIINRFHLPILAFIFHHRLDPEDLITQTQPRSPVTEAFRGLRTNLQHSNSKPIHRLLVTSPTPSDGKTTVAANLAIVAAQGGQRIILIDADLHRPRLHQIFSIGNRIGFSTLFSCTGYSPREMLHLTKIQNLRVMSSGPIPDNPSEILGSERMDEILKRLDSECDLMIIDSPPALSVTDAAVLAPQVDAILLVVKPDTCNLSSLQQTIEQLKWVDGNVMGLVLNEIKTRGSRYSYYYKNYTYYHTYYDSTEPSRTIRSGKKGKGDLDLKELVAKTDFINRPADEKK